ncbi:hypothetical protein BT63DRAFT_320622 [Microthyrium microscopicum]|uniref:Uncharacterized protein n=1 Tax=Microthyrium microscopicum TaxID=703497 RepID=A0A6A6U5I7_9PEZI|nr:hypothetical protein BT63DRAFT_320622 [Microthyrium microscopicum]
MKKAKAKKLELKELKPTQSKKSKKPKKSKLTRRQQQEATDLSSFSKIFWIVPHGPCKHQISVYDLTDAVTPILSHSFYKTCRKYIAQSHDVPAFVARRPAIFKDYKVYSLSPSAEETFVAEWSPSRWECGQQTFTFNSPSNHCDHPIIMRRPKWNCLSEDFVKDSAPYSWRYVPYSWTGWTTLYRKKYGNYVEVAKFIGTRWIWWGVGGALLVDESKMDPLVAILTMCGVIRKERQRGHDDATGGGMVGPIM